MTYIMFRNEIREIYNDVDYYTIDIITNLLYKHFAYKDKNRFSKKTYSYSVILTILKNVKEIRYGTTIIKGTKEEKIKSVQNLIKNVEVNLKREEQYYNQLDWLFGK